jgi:hypothetical protein
MSNVWIGGYGLKEMTATLCPEFTRFSRVTGLAVRMSGLLAGPDSTDNHRNPGTGSGLETARRT